MRITACLTAVVRSTGLTPSTTDRRAGSWLSGPSRTTASISPCRDRVAPCALTMAAVASKTAHQSGLTLRSRMIFSPNSTAPVQTYEHAGSVSGGRCQELRPRGNLRAVRLTAGHAVANRKHGDGRGIVQLQLAHQIGAVLLDGLRAHTQLACDQLVGIAERNPSEHLAFAFGDGLGNRRIRRPLVAREVAREDFIGDRLAQVLLADRHGTDREH